MELFSLVIIFLFACFGSAFPSSDNALMARKEYPYQLIYDFGPGIAPENLYLRSNGQLLVTCLTCGTIFQVDPNAGPSQTARKVYTFPTPASSVIDVLGIDQLEQDVFVVAVGEADFSTILGGGTGAPTVTGPTGLYVVDLRGYQAPDYDSSKVIVKNVGGGNTAGLFDGVAIVNAKMGFVAATDFIEGAIYLVNINKNLTTLIAGPTSITPIGSGGTAQSLALANGLKYQAGKLYFTATTTGTYGYVPINPKTGKAGAPVVIYNYGFALDDFAIAPSTGNVYFTTFAKPNGGVLKRAGGTPIGQNGTTMIASEFATNSAFLVQQGKKCEIFLTVFLQFQVGKVVVPGTC